MTDPLLAAALAARQNAFAPYSHFQVGAAIEDDAGRVHTGCNVENATYGLTICAERVAVFKAISEGVRKFRRVAVAADTDTLDRSPQAPGLLAISLGLGANISDDQELLQAALPIYDALYTWCRSLGGERHGWYPQNILKEMVS